MRYINLLLTLTLTLTFTRSPLDHSQQPPRLATALTSRVRRVAQTTSLLPDRRAPDAACRAHAHDVSGPTSSTLPSHSAGRTAPPARRGSCSR